MNNMLYVVALLALGDKMDALLKSKGVCVSNQYDASLAEKASVILWLLSTDEVDMRAKLVGRNHQRTVWASSIIVRGKQGQINRVYGLCAIKCLECPYLYSITHHGFALYDPPDDKCIWLNDMDDDVCNGFPARITPREGLGSTLANMAREGKKVAIVTTIPDHLSYVCDALVFLHERT